MRPEIRQIKPDEIYRHFKGNLYRVMCVATNTESEEELVVYVDVNNPSKIWARPLSMFNSLVDKKKYPDVVQEYRFEKIQK